MLTGGTWLQPRWPAPVRAVMSLRGQRGADGDSAAPRQYLNLGDHVGDDPAAVARNRARLAQHLGGARPVFLNQVHGTRVLRLDADTPDGAEADAAISTRPQLACTVMVADCLPVLICNRAGSVVAAAHAGWRGLATGVLENTLAKLRQLIAADPAAAQDPQATQLLAWLGPCIGPTQFEVGPEVRQAFIQQDAGAQRCFAPQPTGRYLADLPALARRRLQAQGLQAIHGNDGSAQWCTVSQPAHYFSYRRDQGRLGGSGRMAACIWLDEVKA